MGFSILSFGLSQRFKPERLSNITYGHGENPGSVVSSPFPSHRGGGVMRYFHGGDRGLRVGEFILPATATGRRSTSDIIANNVHRRDRVYVTPDIAAASLYAAVHVLPTVYEVTPEGKLEPDPDCFAPGLSSACERAKILAVHKVPGKVIKKARRALADQPKGEG